MIDFARLAEAPEEVRELASIWPLAFLFNLPPGARVMVAGAWEGRVMELLARVYPEIGSLEGYEPQHEAAERALRRLARAGIAATVHPYGLGVRPEVRAMGDAGTYFASFVNLDPSAARSLDGGAGEGELRNVLTVIGNDPDRLPVHLLVLNVEGYEFELLPYLLDLGAFRSGLIERLALQVHEGFGDFAPIAARLEESHKRVFDELPGWGFWEWSSAKAPGVNTIPDRYLFNQ